MKANAIQDENGRVFLSLQRDDKGDTIEIRSNSPMPSGNILIVTQDFLFSRMEYPPYTLCFVPFFADSSCSVFRHYLESRKIAYEKLLRYLIQSYKNGMVIFLLDDDRYNQQTIEFVDFLQNEMKVSLEVIVYVFRLNTNRRVYMELMKRRCRCITARLKSTMDFSLPQQRIPENMFHFKPGSSGKMAEQSEIISGSLEKIKKNIPLHCGETCKEVVEIRKEEEKPQLKESQDQEESWPAVQQSVLRTRRIVEKTSPGIFKDWERIKASSAHMQKENESTYILKDEVSNINIKGYEKTITLFDEYVSEEKPNRSISKSSEEDTLVLTIKDGYTLSMDFPDLEAIILLDNLGIIWQGVIQLLQKHCPDLALLDILNSCIKMLKTEIYYRECVPFYERTLEKLSDQILEISHDSKRAKSGFIIRTDYPEWLEYPSRIADILFRLIAIVLLKIQTKISAEARSTISYDLLSLLDIHLPYYSLPCIHNPGRQCQSKKLFQYFRSCPLPKGEKEMAYFCCGVTNEHEPTLVIPKGVKK